MATVAALLGIEESRTLWAVWGTTQLHIGGYRSVHSGEWLLIFRSSSSDNPWTSLVNHPCFCLIAPISQHIMLPQSPVATALIFNWEAPHWSGIPNIARSRLSQCSKSCDLQSSPHCGVQRGGCHQSIGSTVSDAIVSSWLWLTTTRSSPLFYLSKFLQVVGNWP